MTLQEWSALNPQITINETPDGKGRIVILYHNSLYYRRLWTLEDYVVSSARDSQITLIPAYANM